jgi:hypothetical protein
MFRNDITTLTGQGHNPRFFLMREARLARPLDHASKIKLGLGILQRENVLEWLFSARFRLPRCGRTVLM